MSSLAAARADNFYYPPGWTPEQGSLNKYHGQHALRERARKLDQGILIIRFEMPFHVWCGGCESMIAKGVRFNAEKKQIGNYHSTKIWSFKMKSACCQHEIEIHTDPKNCDYVVVSGAQKKVVEYDAEEAGTTALPTEEERELLSDPLYRVEHGGEDVKKAQSRKPELLRIKSAADARHADTWGLNSLLRGKLRAQKKRLAAEEEEARSKGLGIRLLASADEDRAGAAVAVFRPRFEENRRERRAAIRASSIFSTRAEIPLAAEPSKGGSLLRAAAAGRMPTVSGSEHSSFLEGMHCQGLTAPAKTRVKTSGHQAQSRIVHGEGSIIQHHKRALPLSCGEGGGQGKQAAHTSDHLRRAQLAAKRRKIDAKGVLAAATGKFA